MSRLSVLARAGLVVALLVIGAGAVKAAPGLLSGGVRSVLDRLESLPGNDGPSGPAGDVAGGAGGPSVAAETPPASSTSSETTGDNPPSVDAVIEGTLGQNGWYTSDVSLTWKIEGGTAAEGSCSPQSISADGTVDHSCTATSEDGSSRTTKATIARDATAPAGVTVAADRAPDHNGWYNKPFTATWTGEDPTSGIDTCTATTYSGPDAAARSLDGLCTDKAGNVSGTVPFAFAYDATAPVATATPDRAPDHNGWYNHGVTITWSADGASCDAPTSYTGPDAAAAKLTGSCTDEAGNKGTASITLAYDATAPVIVISAPDDGGTYVLNQPVAADYSCTDATADVASCAGTVADGANIDTGSVGGHSFKVGAADKAGNEASMSRSYSVKYAAVGALCGGVRGHEILQPVAADGSSVFNQGRTVPAKFRVCDYFGAPVSTPGVVKSFRISSINGSDADMAPKSTSSHQEFRSGEGQWIFNVDTKPLSAGSRYGFRIKLDDGTSIELAFTLR